MLYLCTGHTKVKLNMNIHVAVAAATFKIYSLVIGSNRSCATSTPRRAYSPAAISAHRTHFHLCPTRYYFTHESSEACEGDVPCPRTQHRNNFQTLRGEKHDISLKILHQAWFETARQAATIRHALAMVPRPSLI